MERSESPQEQIPSTSSGQKMVPAGHVWEALKECYDPEIPVNIVELGLVYELKVEEEVPGEANVYIRMTLTAPGCGMGPMIASDVKRRVSQIPGVKNVHVELVFDPIWTTSMMSEAAKLMLNIQ
jgi:probable FeS assembly SUF system protein SufT